MRLKAFALVVLSAYWPLPSAVRAQQSGTSAAPSWNDNFLIKVQKDGGNATRSGDVKIEFMDTMHSRSHHRPV